VVMCSMLQHEPRALYKGMGASLIGAVPTSVVYMPTYEFSKMALLKLAAAAPGVKIPVAQVASVATGLACSSVRVPTSVVKARLQLGFSSSVRHAVAAALQNGGGWRGLYAGWYATCVLDVSYALVQFTVLERLVALCGATIARGRMLSSGENALVGFLVGVITAILTEPLDVVKTRLQTQRRDPRSICGTDFGYAGVFDGLHKMVQLEGVLALWRGLLPRLLLKGWGSCIWYSAYTMLRNIMEGV